MLIRKLGDQKESIRSPDFLIQLTTISFICIRSDDIKFIKLIYWLF